MIQQLNTIKIQALKELNYIESVVYELENCSSLDEVTEIFEEISENDIFKERTSKSTTKKSKVKKSKLTKNKEVLFACILFTPMLSFKSKTKKYKG